MMKTCLLPGVALCLLLGSLAGERLPHLPARSPPLILLPWGGGRLVGLPGVTALLLLCRGQACAGRGR